MNYHLTDQITEQALRICESHRERLSAPGLCIKIFNHLSEEVLQLQSCDGTSRGESLLNTKRFPIGSLTKSFVAAAILILRDAKNLDLTDSPKRFIPELESHRTFDWSTRTIFDLLTMQSGLTADYQGSWAEQTMALTPSELRILLSHEPHSTASSREKYEYSNLSYILLGRIISEVSGLNAMEFIRRKIIVPLELSDTNWSGEGEDVAKGFELHGEQWREEPRVASKCDAAALGGVVSSYRDLSSWITFLAGANDDTDIILRVSSRRELTSPKIQRAIDADYTGKCRPSTYGYGVTQVVVGKEWGIGHGGAVPGFGTYFLWLPSIQLSIVAVANRRYVPVNDPCYEIAELLIENAPKRRGESSIVELRGTELLVLSKNWNREQADKIFDQSLWHDLLEEEVSEMLGKIGASTDPCALEVQDSVTGKIIIGNGGEVFYYLNPLTPGLIQSIECK